MSAVRITWGERQSRLEPLRSHISRIKYDCSRCPPGTSDTVPRIAETFNTASKAFSDGVMRLNQNRGASCRMKSKNIPETGPYQGKRRKKKELSRIKAFEPSSPVSSEIQIIPATNEGILSVEGHMYHMTEINPARNQMHLHDEERSEAGGHLAATAYRNRWVTVAGG